MAPELSRADEAAVEIIGESKGAILVTGDRGLETSIRLAATGRDIFAVTEDRREDWPSALNPLVRPHYAMIRSAPGWAHRGETPDHTPNIINAYTLEEFHDVKMNRTPLAALIIRDGFYALAVLKHPWPTLDHVPCIAIETGDARIRSVVTKWADLAGLEVYDEKSDWIAYSRKPA